MLTWRKLLTGGAFIALWMALPGLALFVGLAPPTVPALPPSVRNGGRVIQDMSGGDVWLRTDPPSKVAILSHVWPIYATLEAGVDHIAGLSRQARLFTSGGLIEGVYPGIAALPQTGAMLNVEQLMVWDPDAILTLKDASADVLKAIGIPGLFQMTFNGAGWRRPILNIWRAVGGLDNRKARANAIIDRYETAPKAESAETVHGTPIRVISIWSFGDTWSIGTRRYYLNEVFPLAGAVNVAANGVFASINIEQALLMDPDVIFLGHFGDHPGPEKLFSAPEWRAMRAVRDRRVYLMPIHSFYNWPIDITILVAWMRDLLEPALQRSKVQDELRQTYRDVYGHDFDDDDIAHALVLEENKASDGYGRFRTARE